MDITKFSIEVLVVGFVFAVIGTILTYIFSNASHKGELFKVSSIFFMTGAIGHILFEIIDANKWYCKNGHACVI